MVLGAVGRIRGACQSHILLSGTSDIFSIYDIYVFLQVARFKDNNAKLEKTS